MATLVSVGLPTYYANGRRLVRLSDGALYCVYHRANGAWQIYVKKSTDDGITWTDETRISTYAGMATVTQAVPSIAVDSSDHLHVVWHGFATGFTARYQVWYNTYNGSSWAGPVRISDYAGMQSDHQRYPSIAVDGSDNLHVVWDGEGTGFTTDNQIWYNKYDGSWAGPVRISDYAGMDNYTQGQPAVAIDSHDYIHVAWYGMATGFTFDNQIWYNKYDGSWAGPVRISDYAGMTGEPQDAPSIAVDSNDYIHVAWEGGAFGLINSQIWYNKYDGSWAGTVRISDYDGMDSYSQDNPSITVDATDGVHVAWFGKATGYTATNVLWYNKYVAAWAGPEVIQTPGEMSSPNLRGSRYPSSNIPSISVDYVFTEAGVNIYWDEEALPAPTGMAGLNPALVELVAGVV